MVLLPAQPHAAELQSSTSTISHADQKKLLQDLHHLVAERQLLLPRIKTLEEPDHDPVFYEGNGSDLNGAFDGQMNMLFELPARILELEQRIKLLAERINSLEENWMRSRGKERQHVGLRSLGIF